MTQAKQLLKTLGLWDVFAISAGAMVSAGIFLLPGTAFSHVGPAVTLSYILGGAIATLGILAVLEMATAMPQAGGIYFFATRSLGPLAGTLSGILNWAALSLKSAFAIWGTAQLAHLFFPALPAQPYGVALTAAFLVLNLLSTRAAASFEQALVWVLLAIMLLYVVCGAHFADPARFAPPLLPGVRPVAAVFEAGFLFVSFGGLLGVISVAEEIRSPRRNIPMGILLALLVVTALYGLTMAVTIGVLPAEALAGSFAPLADAARLHFGRAGYAVLTVGALLAFVTTGNAGLMGAARYPVALARDGCAPAVFAHVAGARRIPAPALLLTGSVVAAAQFLDIESIVKVSSTVVMLSYILANLSVFIIRESGVMNYRPSFRTPFYPVTPLLAVFLFVLLIVKLGDQALGLSALLIAFGVALYMRYGMRQKRETALRSLIGRLVRPDYEAPVLERELLEVVRARDEMVEDDFDRAIASAPTFVARGELSPEEFFAATAELAAGALESTGESLAARLMARERLSSTVIAPGVAVPHLTLAGTKGRFLVLIAKSDVGVPFETEGGETEMVHTAVVLFSSPDRRASHLRTLAKVAQTILDPTFAKRWEKARTPQQLRDLFLLARRTRA
ncbi:MAG: amino acid permease [Kiritimatiellae bacterium]|nr:amino acid permease [Kiritimatiellia bacterium]